MITRRAAGDTAIRPVSFSMPGCSTVPNTCSARLREVAVWKVATIGPRADQSASIDTDGTVGSCRCSTSNRPRAASAGCGRATAARSTAARPSRCTAPAPRGRPGRRTPAGRGRRARRRAPAPAPRGRAQKVSARSCTCACTPPGTSQTYGQTSPTLMRRGGGRGREVVQPEALQHVPVCGVRGDAGGERVGERLRHGRDVGVRHRLVEGAQPAASVKASVTGSSTAPVARARLRRAGRHPGGRAEELHVDAARRQVAVGEQAERPAGPQPLLEHRVRRALPAGERQHLHAERAAEGEEAVEQRLRLQPLGHGREGRAGGAAPGAGVVPVAAVRQRQHDAGRRGDGGAEALLARRCASRPRRARGGVTGSRNTSHQ